MKKAKTLYLAPLLTALILLSPNNALAEICLDIIDQFYFAEKSSIESSYFDKYLIGKKNSIYYIHAVKTTETDFNNLVEVFKDMDQYPKFMLGYKGIKVRHTSDAIKLTRILFDPPKSPFISQFTNEVEIVSEHSYYLQCWNQLDENDSRVEDKNKNAPVVNKGYWRLHNLNNEGTRISYHIVIEPPISLPLFLYRMLVKNTYVNTFDRILKRAEYLNKIDGAESNK